MRRAISVSDLQHGARFRPRVKEYDAPAVVAPVLPRFCHRPIRALAESLFDRGQGVPEARVAWMIDDLGDFLARAGGKTRTFFLITVMLLEWLPFLFGRFSRLSRLRVEKRVECLERLDASFLAPLIALPKAMLGLVYYEHPEALLETGYDHRPLVEARQSE
jgi:hypothetical protein